MPMRSPIAATRASRRVWWGLWLKCLIEVLATSRMKQRAFEAVQALIAGSSSTLASEGYSKTFVLNHDLHGRLTVPKTFIMVPSKVTVVLREEDDLDQIDLSDMELAVDIDKEAAFVGLEQLGVAGASVLEADSHGGAAGSGACGGSAAAAGDGLGGPRGAAALLLASDVAPELDGCTVASPGTMGPAEGALNDAVVLGIAPPGLGERAGLTEDNVLTAVDSIPGLSAGALASLGVREPASAPGSQAGAGARQGTQVDVRVHRCQSAKLHPRGKHRSYGSHHQRCQGPGQRDEE